MTRYWTHLTVLGFCLSASRTGAQTAAEPDQRIWSVDIDSKVRHYGLSRTGVLFIRTEKAIVGWRVDSGQQVWRVEFPSSDLAIVGVDTGIAWDGKGLVALDLDTGKRLWTLEALPLGRLKGLRRATDNLALAFGSVDDTTFRVIGIEVETGRIIWSNDSIAVGDRIKAKDVFLFTFYVALPDSTLILQFNRGGMVRLDATTGAVMWRIDSKPEFSIGWPPANGLWEMLGLGSAEPLVSGDYMVTESGAVSVKTGSVVWRVPDKPSGWTAAMTETSRGVVTVRGSTSKRGRASDRRTLQLIDPTTGAGLWPMPVILKGLLAHTIREDTLFVAFDRGLAAIDLSTGTLQKQMQLPDFTNGEEPLSIKGLSDGDFLLQSANNLMRVTSGGSVVFHLHYGVPMVGFKPLTGVVMPLARNPENLTYIHTNDTDILGQKGIVLIDREHGRELGTVRRKDRAPSYAIDVMTRLAVAIEDQRLTGFRFAQLPKQR